MSCELPRMKARTLASVNRVSTVLVLRTWLGLGLGLGLGLELGLGSGKRVSTVLVLRT